MIFSRSVLGQLHFNVNIVNSIIVAGCTTLIAITISALGAYGVVRFFPKFGKVLTRVLITTYMFPPILLAVPYSIIMGKAGMMNNRAGLHIVYLSFAVPTPYGCWWAFSRLCPWKSKRRPGWMAPTSCKYSVKWSCPS